MKPVVCPAPEPLVHGLSCAGSSAPATLVKWCGGGWVGSGRSSGEWVGDRPPPSSDNDTLTTQPLDQLQTSDLEESSSTSAILEAARSGVVSRATRPASSPSQLRAAYGAKRYGQATVPGTPGAAGGAGSDRQQSCCWVSLPVSIWEAATGLSGGPNVTIQTIDSDHYDHRPIHEHSQRADAIGGASGWKGRFNRQRLRRILRDQSSAQAISFASKAVADSLARSVPADSAGRWGAIQAGVLVKARIPGRVRRHQPGDDELPCLSWFALGLQPDELVLENSCLLALRTARFSERLNRRILHPGHKVPVPAERLLRCFHWSGELASTDQPTAPATVSTMPPAVMAEIEPCHASVVEAPAALPTRPRAAHTGLPRT